MQKILSILLTVLFLSACQMGGQKGFMQSDDNISIYRYDRLQYDAAILNSVSALQKMNTESPQATKILIEDVLCLGPVNANHINARLRNYFKDTLLVQVMQDVETKFKDLSWLEEDFTDAFKRLKKNLPNLVVPRIYVQNSALNQSVVVGDSLLGISLDKYLGEDYPLYKKYYYAYQRKSMNPERIVPDCLTFYLFSQYPFLWEQTHRTLFDIIMYRGKIAWIVEKALKADGSGKLALGYTEEELDWCDNNGERVWKLMKERKHLESMDPLLIRAYTYPDPIPVLKDKKVPSCLGIWMGMQIIREYMKQHPDVTMAELLDDTDYHRILKNTRY